MPTFSVPENGRIIQPNKGEFSGNVLASLGMDFSSEPGRIIASPTMKNIFDQNDDADFDNPVAAFEFYGDKWWAITDVLFKSATGYPDSAWAQDAIGSSPSGDWKEMDSEVFDGLLLVSGTGASQDDIFAFNGTTWSSWWKGTLAQTALDTTVFKPIKEGATGRLYILDAQTKVYNVTNTGTVTKTGNGTLDFSATTLKLICMEPSSSRLWLGGTDTSGGNAVIVEWDMSLNASTPNKIHKLQGRSVQSICIWNDTPIAVLSTGELHIFNGSYFQAIENAQLPEPPSGFTYKGELSGVSTISVDSGIIHPNGWAIVDGLPHFLFNTTIVNKVGTEQGGHWNAPSGVWAYDPQVGLYNRNAVAREAGTVDYASHDIAKHGAMKFVGSGAGEFLASASVYSNSGSNSTAVLMIQNNERTIASRSSMVMIPFQAGRHDIWQSIEAMLNRFSSASDSILIKYRLHKSATLPASADVTWTSTTVFTSTDTDFANVEAGDEITVIRGNGAGCTSHIATISYSAPTYTVTLLDPVLNITASDTGRVRIDNWNLLATMASQREDYYEFAFPFSEDSFKLWVKVEFRNAAASVIELDKIIINSKNQKA